MPRETIASIFNVPWLIGLYVCSAVVEAINEWGYEGDL